MTNRIVVFGGGGFIGKTFVRMFAEDFDELVVIDRFAGPAHPRPDACERFMRDVDPQRVRTIRADAADAATFGPILESAAAVLVLNADTGTANSFEAPHVCVRENVQVLLAQVNAIRTYCKPGGIRVLFTSSRAVYGEGAWFCSTHGRTAPNRSTQALQRAQFAPLCPECGQDLELRGTIETDRQVPLSVYGATKRAGEDLLRTTLTPLGFDLRIVRFQNVYGPGQEISNPYTGVLNWFSMQLLKQAPVEIYERGHIRRDFIFVDDAARLLRQLLTSPAPSAEPLVINGGSGAAVRLADVAAMLKQQYASRSMIADSDKFRIGDVLGACADMTAARVSCGFECQVGLADGLARYARWFASQVLQ